MSGPRKGLRPAGPDRKEGESSMAFARICELGYCPYSDLYPLPASDVLTCDDCPHSVYIDTAVLDASSEQSHPRDLLG